NANEVTHVDTPQEALAASLNKFGEVNLEYMENLSETGRQELLTQLDNRIFYNPMMKNYEIKDRFIAGNVVAKVEWIENYLKDYPDDDASKKSLEALRKAIPEPISFELLDFNLGERWIPMSVYEEFAGYLFESKAHIHYTESIDEFSVSLEETNANITDKYYVKGEKRGYYGNDLLKHALHNTVPDITKTVQDEEGNDIKVRDAEAIQLADAKINEIRSAFTSWLNEQLPEFKRHLADMYNRKFNCYVRPDYDGSLQSFPFLDLKGLGIPSLYDSQKNAVWMLKMNGGGIIDHQVGT
ncbi:DNA methylase, partial [Bacteroides ovatus]